jgi:protein-S-isoprenylcysteine O-methyltransferase Ste14
MTYEWLIAAMWLGWLVLWVAMARRVKPVAQAESPSSRLLHVAPLALACYLLAAPHVPFFALEDRFAPLALWPVRLGATLTFAGLALAVWARVLLAGNWSGIVTLKHDHELVVEGPYRWVRHPIYTGLLIALIGTALALGQWRGVLAVAIAGVALWRKLRLEESFMRREFGEAYARYAQRVPALVPFVL